MKRERLRTQPEWVTRAADKAERTSRKKRSKPRLRLADLDDEDEDQEAYERELSKPMKKHKKREKPIVPIDPPITKAPMGRPPSFKKEFVAIAGDLARGGATDEEIAEALGIDRRCLYAWKNKYLDFAHAIKRGKDIEDERVEAALYSRASGADRLPGYDTSAALAWMRTRKGWMRDGHQTVHQTVVNINPDKVPGLSEREVAALRSALKKVQERTPGEAAKLIEGKAVADADEYEATLS